MVNSMREMKDSGIDWVGEIPEIWALKRNKEIFIEVNEIANANTKLDLLSVSEYYGVAKRKDVISSEDTLMRADSLDGYKICNADDLVINIMLAWKGALGISPYRGLVSPAYNVFRTKSIDFIPKYYQYLFQTSMYTTIFKRYSTGIVDSRLRLYPNIFLSLTSHFPSTCEQKSIADFLDRKVAFIDNIIEKTKESIEEYKKLKQSIITEAVTKGLNPDVKMKDSGIEWIGDIPEHWEMSMLKRNCWYQEGPGIMGDDFREEGIPLIRISGMKSDRVTLDGCNFLDEEAVQKRWNHFKLDLGDIVISASASTGIVAVVDSETVGAIPYTGLIRFKTYEKLLPEYLMYFITSDIYLEQINQQQTGTTIQHYGPSHLSKIKIVLPPINEQMNIIELLKIKVNKIENTLDKKELLLSELELYKKSLIYEVVTGKKEIPTQEVGTLGL